VLRSSVVLCGSFVLRERLRFVLPQEVLPQEALLPWSVRRHARLPVRLWLPQEVPQGLRRL
jgi:hypothetical protein